MIYFYFVYSQKRDGRARLVRTIRGTARRKTSRPGQGLIVRQAYDIRKTSSSIPVSGASVMYQDR